MILLRMSLYLLTRWRLWARELSPPLGIGMVRWQKGQEKDFVLAPSLIIYWIYWVQNWKNDNKRAYKDHNKVDYNLDSKYNSN